MGESVSAEEVEALTMVEATKLALGRATHLLPTDAGVVALWLRQARAIDDIDEDGLNPAGKLDNVSMPSYLKTAESLRMTPVSRESALKSPAPKKPEVVSNGPSNVTQLRGPIQRDA